MYKVIRFNALLATKWRFFFFVQTLTGPMLWTILGFVVVVSFVVGNHLWKGTAVTRKKSKFVDNVMNACCALLVSYTCICTKPYGTYVLNIRISSQVIYLPWKGGLITNSSEFCVNELFLSIYRTKNFLVFPAPQTRLQNTI